MIFLRKAITQNFPLKAGGFVYFMVFIQFFYLYQLSASNDIGGISFSWASIGLVFLSLSSVFLFFQTIICACGWSRTSSVISALIGLVVYDLLVAYHFGAQDLAEWGFIIENVSSAFSLDAWDVMISSLDLGALGYLALILTIFIPLELWRKSISNSQVHKRRLVKSIFGAALYMLIIIYPIDSYDPVVNFFRSIIHHYFEDNSFKQVQLEKEFSLEKEIAIYPRHTTKKTPPYPNVFYIVCESLNASVLNKISTTGKPITPFLNKLANKSLHIPIFYGNSIQTAKGHFASYFSVIPALTGKTFVKHPNLKIKSMGHTFSENGYKTIYFNAYSKKHFDNEYNFLTSNGYPTFKTVTPYLTDKDKKNSLRWGVEDKVFFKRFFDYYDQELAKEKKPLFITLATIANHFPFNSMSSDRRFIHATPKPLPAGLEQHYENSIHLTDQGIATFFEELKKRPALKNSIVIVTGDHAFPMGEHGNYNLESGYHEDSFRIPFFMVWAGHLDAQTISYPASQMDIAPTLIDLLDFKKGVGNFQGSSIFSGPRPIYLIQPYGKHLSIILYPLKYRFNTRLHKEYVYNLIKDPLEKDNIINKTSPITMQKFRSELFKIYQTNEAILQDKVNK